MNNQNVLAAAPDHIADASKMVAPAVQGEPVGYVRPHQLEALRSGKACGITLEDKPDAHNRVTIPLYAAQQPAPDVAGLVDLLRDIGDVCRQLEMPSERAIAEWADRIDAALAAHFKRDSQPSPAIQEGYAGATVWIGDKRVTQVVTEGSIKYESETGMAITHAAQACLDLLAAAHREGEEL